MVTRRAPSVTSLPSYYVGHYVGPLDHASALPVSWRVQDLFVVLAIVVLLVVSRFAFDWLEARVRRRKNGAKKDR